LRHRVYLCKYYPEWKNAEAFNVIAIKLLEQNAIVRVQLNHKVRSGTASPVVISRGIAWEGRFHC